MSRVAFISDIHGNFPALQAVLEDCRNKKVDSIYCLGDLVGYYSQINEVIDIIRQDHIPCIMGNHDFAMVKNNGIINRSKTCTNVLIKQRSFITPENFKFLKELENHAIINIDGAKVLCIHGGINDYIDEYIGELTDEYFSKLPQDITHVVSAHSHKATVISFSRIHYANSGSVGQPRDHDARASYVILKDGEFEIERVEYSIDATVNKMKDNGFPDYIAQVLYTGKRIGE
jgi:putative phosphoesterase